MTNELSFDSIELMESGCLSFDRNCGKRSGLLETVLRDKNIRQETVFLAEREISTTVRDTKGDYNNVAAGTYLSRVLRSTFKEKEEN